jgi:hypothetical protein
MRFCSLGRLGVGLFFAMFGASFELCTPTLGPNRRRPLITC